MGEGFDFLGGKSPCYGLLLSGFEGVFKAFCFFSGLKGIFQAFLKGFWLVLGGFKGFLLVCRCV